MKLEMPLAIQLGKKKYSISLNTYRNLHYQINNKLKKTYKEIVESKIWKAKEKLSWVWLTFYYHNPTKRKSDLDNVCWIHCKFLQDALVELWYIEDDNYDYIQQIRYIYWWYIKNCETIDILITEFF